MMLRALIKSMRPRQWTKNLVIFAALVFDGQLFSIPAFLRTFVGFIIFCLLSGVVYIINDLADIEADRKHPVKRNRPIAAGKLSSKAAVTAVVILLLLLIPISFFLSIEFGWIALGYMLLNLAYSKWLKHIPLLDVLMIALFFDLRVGAGVRADPRPTLFTLAVCSNHFGGALPGARQAAGRAGSPGGGCQLSPQGFGWVHHPIIGPVYYDRVCHDHHGLQPVYIFCPKPADQPHHDADHTFCFIRSLPLPVSDSGHLPGRCAGRCALV